MVVRNQGLGRIWKTLWKPRVAVCLESDLFFCQNCLFCLHTPSVECLLPPHSFSRMPSGAHGSPISISYLHLHMLLTQLHPAFQKARFSLLTHDTLALLGAARWLKR